MLDLLLLLKFCVNFTKVKLEVITTVEEIDPSKFEVVFTPTNSWGTYYYQYNVKVTNKTGKNNILAIRCYLANRY